MKLEVGVDGVSGSCIQRETGVVKDELCGGREKLTKKIMGSIC